jgi:hypothetical protein
LSVVVVALAANQLIGCAPSGPTATASHDATLRTAAPARRSGLWEQTIMRDGKSARHGVLSVCLNATRENPQWVFGDGLPSTRCRREISRDASGAYHFASTCRLGDQAVLTSTGVATGDFSSGYHVRSVLTVTGAPFAELDGHHAVEMVARYRGACPAGMAPGEVGVAHGVRLDTRRLPQLAGAFTGA